MTREAKSICFVGLDSYPVFNPDYAHHYFGGESVQQTLLARAFRDIGYKVSMIVMDYGQPEDEVID
ncbi:MAG: glycosyl transferase family 1, partial [Phycisphaerae bacterium]|nr:glycosyl transferase family 1 [Phycisphaerae bacterium]NIW46463.1 glycosyl transferase family 1 [Gammaproteobacteria bacterium]NIP56194.1 glycosyl transferase family 1 [Phycisphaerae bacterium]NIU12259.1 glycosyl transferase family 1 [Phycisphaerae bacterium]NIW97692.1 glycosyl transferase family 1 [Phycisphaerae bacterium]